MPRAIQIEPKTTQVPFRENVAYIIVRTAMKLFANLPWTLLYPTSRFLGLLCFHALNRERVRATLSLRLAFADRLSARRLRLLTKGMFLHFAMMSAECLKLFNHPDGHIWEKIRLDRPDLLKGALAKGKGAVVFTAHAGNWEYLAAGLFHSGFTGLVVSRKIRSPKFQELVKQWRQKLNILEWNTEESPKALLDCLRRNLCIGVLNDQDIRKARGIFVDFFGIPAYTPTFVSELSYKTKAPMVPCLAVRRKDRTHVIKIYPEIAPRAGETKEDYVRRSQQEYATLLEKTLRHHPTQWVWFHKRWKTRPSFTS
jgi:Kdo2-lipid IVA lauroyltransferase/acyltransferase